MNRIDLRVSAAPVLLAAIVALGAWLRLTGLGHSDLWFDEAFTVVYVARPFDELWLAPRDPTPPLYYTLHKLLVGESTDPATVRLLSWAFGTAAVPAMYGLMRPLGGASALIAALALAVSPYHVIYSQEARAYALLILLLLLALWAFARALRCWRANDDGRRAYSVFAALSVLAVYAHFTAVFVVIPFLFGGVLLLRALSISQSAERWAMVSALIAATALVPAVLMATLEFGGFNSFPSRSFASALNLITHLLVPSNFIVFSGIAVPALVALMVAGLWNIRGQPELLVSVCMLCVAPFAMWAVQWAKPVLVTKTALPLVLVPPMLLGAACALPSRGAVPAAVALLAGALGAGVLSRDRDAWYSRTAWPQAVRTIEARASPGDAVLLCQHYRWITWRLNASAGSSLPVITPVDDEWIVLFPPPAEERTDWRLRAATWDYRPLLRRAAGAVPEGTLWLVELHRLGDHCNDKMEAFAKAEGRESSPVATFPGISVYRLDRTSKTH